MTLTPGNECDRDNTQPGDPKQAFDYCRGQCDNHGVGSLMYEVCVAACGDILHTCCLYNCDDFCNGPELYGTMSGVPPCANLDDTSSGDAQDAYLACKEKCTGDYYQHNTMHWPCQTACNKHHNSSSSHSGDAQNAYLACKDKCGGDHYQHNTMYWPCCSSHLGDA